MAGFRVQGLGFRFQGLGIAGHAASAAVRLWDLSQSSGTPRSLTAHITSADS